MDEKLWEGETGGSILKRRRITGKRNGGVVRQYQGKGVAEKSQGKDSGVVGPVSLDGCNEVHQNSLYWEQVDWVDASASNRGTIYQ